MRIQTTYSNSIYEFGLNKIRRSCSISNSSRQYSFGWKSSLELPPSNSPPSEILLWLWISDGGTNENGEFRMAIWLHSSYRQSSARTLCGSLPISEIESAHRFKCPPNSASRSIEHVSSKIIGPGWIEIDELFLESNKLVWLLCHQKEPQIYRYWIIISQSTLVLKQKWLIVMSQILLSLLLFHVEN